MLSEGQINVNYANSKKCLLSLKSGVDWIYLSRGKKFTFFPTSPIKFIHLCQLGEIQKREWTPTPSAPKLSTPLRLDIFF